MLHWNLHNPKIRHCKNIGKTVYRNTVLNRMTSNVSKAFATIRVLASKEPNLKEHFLKLNNVVKTFAFECAQNSIWTRAKGVVLIVKNSFEGKCSSWACKIIEHRRFLINQISQFCKLSKYRVKNCINKSANRPLW